MSGMMIINAEKFERGRLMPYCGTIFTARLPENYGGINSEVQLHICDNPFGKYQGSSTLSHAPFASPSIFGMRAGDYGRFIIDDNLLPTGHPVSERNWFKARFLRPVLTSTRRIKRVSRELRDGLLPECFEQRIVSPENTALMIDASLSRETDDISTTSGTVNNDLRFISSISPSSADLLQDFYESLRKPL